MQLNMNWELLANKDYAFLSENKILSDNIMLLAMGGSYSYGTNIEGSDIDLRGIMYNPIESLLGNESFGQYTDNNTDTVIYGLNKTFKLLLECNPNAIEILGCKPEHYILMNKDGKKLIENKEVFLSKKAIYTFVGYANSQLKKMQNILLKSNVLQKEKDRKINKCAMHSIRSFFMCIDILEKGEINTYREKEHDLLMSIRNGGFQKEDGGYREEFFELVGDLTTKIKYAAKNTDLPECPDYNMANEILMNMNKEHILRK